MTDTPERDDFDPSSGIEADYLDDFTEADLSGEFAEPTYLVDPEEIRRTDAHGDEDDHAPRPAVTSEPVAAPAVPLAAADAVDDATALDDETAAEIASALAPVVAEQRSAGAISPKWDEPDYVPGGNNGSGAWKLGDSAVAPLVVAARGYETINEEDLADAVKKYNLPRKNSAQGKRIAESIQRGDILIMPWFTTQDLAAAARSGKEALPSTTQYRPARPAQDEKTGKDLKYEFVGGQKTPVGIHPSYPRDWIESAPVVLLAEGLLKGDSALTGYLLDAGVAPEALEFDGVGGTTAARARLAGILDSIPLERRVVVFTIGGVWNWRNNSEWVDLELKNRDTWVGVDGDVASNPHVFKACTELWEFLTEKKKTRASLIAPTVQASDGEKKVGIDDYLAKYGNWRGLTSMLAPTLPKAPPSNDVENIGKHRISEKGTALEFCEPVCDDAFNPTTPTRGKWVEVLPIGGRILSTVAQRIPTQQEIKTGVLGEGANNDDAEAFCEVEICWDANGEVHKHVISGPANILNYTPDQWDRHKAHIPAAILKNAEWPPPRKIGEEWLRAMKAHRIEEATDRVRWDSMGWVPVDGTVPAFVVGDQVIGADDAPGIDIFAGITETELAGANRFGVGDEFVVDGSDDFEDPAYVAQVRADIEDTLEAFVLSDAWSDRGVASTVVAAALRPVLPIRPHTTLYLVGPPGKGKSFTAAMMMGFWSRRAGLFTGSSLPGSAKDTAASMELAVARAPIWVVDDLAPASSRQQSENEQNKIGDLIRNVFNGAGKRRSTADMGSRKVHVPRALLVVTAENEAQVASVRDRCITLDIGWGALAKSSDPTDRVQELCQDDGAPARVTQAMIRFLRWEAKRMPGKWADLYSLADDFLLKAQDNADSRMKKRGAKPGDVKRHANLAGDIAVSLLYLRRLAEQVGVREDILNLLTNSGMIGDVYDLVARGHKATKEATQGRALLEAIQSSLFRKKAHILDATDAAAAPGGPNIAPMLGWEVGTEGSRPKGDTIGYLVTDEKTGEQVVFLEQKAAFSVAQREYPNLVPPGQGPRSSWGSVIGEKLHEDHLLRKRSDGSKLNTGRTRASDVDISGVPIRLSVLLRGGAPEETEQQSLDDR